LLVGSVEGVGVITAVFVAHTLRTISRLPTALVEDVVAFDDLWRSPAAQTRQPRRSFLPTTAAFVGSDDPQRSHGA
jgi:hypothetical protein